MNTKINDKWLSWILLAFLSLTWGSSYILIKKSLIAFSAIQVASMRLSISALAFIPVFIIIFKKIDWSKWKSLLVVGVAGSAFPAFFFAFAQTELSSSMTGVLSSLTPLVTFLIGILAFRTVVSRNKILGIALGLIGAFFIIWLSKNGQSNGNMWFGFLVLMGTIGYGWSSNTVANELQAMKSLHISAISFIMIGTPAFLSLFLTDIISVFQSHPHAWPSFGYLTLLAILGTVIGSILFFKLVQITNAVFASFVSYLTPIIALFWGLFDGEIITLTSLIGLCLILTGVFIARDK